MSKPEHPISGCGDDQTEKSAQGPSLKLLYGLLVLALAAAIGFALLIVLPFYHRR